MIVAEKEVERYEITRYIASGAMILDSQVIAGDNIPIIPMYGERAYVAGDDGLHIIDSNETGEDRNHPHGHWINCGEGEDTTAPNVFKGMGFAGSISTQGL